MGKVFRIHSSGEVKTGWFQSSQIGAKELETIKADKDDVATSIPSPFARIDLVKTAFGWVSNHELTGESGYHKLVSDALDVAQLFYLSKNAQYRNDITIVEWSKESVVDKYKDEKASSFFSSFEVFWKQDGNNYNLDSSQRLYFIYYKNRLVGATSPSTLFVSAPDASSSFLEMDITRGTDKLFDDRYAALHEREFPFVKYIFSLSKTPEFQRFFRETNKNEFYEYLQKVREALPSSKRAEIDQLNSESIKTYPICTTSDSNSNEVSILGIRLGTEIQNTAIDSDFFIKSDKGKRALILPQARFNRTWKYTSSDDIWNTEEMYGSVPIKNPNPQNSVLPVNGTTILWYSEGDFLADEIMVLEPTGIGNTISKYPIDLSSFNTGILEEGTNCLLPLTSTFFEYFDAVDARNYCKVKKTGVLITVSLEIPTSEGTVSFNRIYKTENQIQINICLALLSLIRVSEDNSPNFIGFQYKKDNRITYELNPRLNNGNPCAFKKENRDTGESSSWVAQVFKTSENYDYLELKVNGASNVIIPEWKWLTPSTEIEFAIDFGTTNTHIEYRKKGQGALSNLEYSIGSGTLTYLLDIKKWNEIPPGDIKQFYPQFEKYLFPLTIGQNVESHFPMRSALSYNEHIDYGTVSNALLDGNSYHFYERRSIADTQKIKTDLKWSNYDDSRDKTLVKLYVESLLQLVRIKAINEGCHPKNVKIKWFYPVSMNHHEKGMLSEIWEKYFSSVFEKADPNNLLRISESVAPYLYYRNKYPGTSMTIDIGGGSTDVALFDNDSPEASYITSFKFAGNSIFGDGYTSQQRQLDTDLNGFVNIFSQRAQELLNNDRYNELSRIESRLRTASKNSADYVSFLFSLEEDKNLNFNFGEELKANKKINMAFLLFYASILYYSAQLQKKLGKTIPDNFIFSGTASKTLLFLDNSRSEGFKMIKDLILHIYSKVFEGEDFTNKMIQIELDKEPKQVTARGGLKLTDRERLAEDKVLLWLGGRNDLDKVVDKERDISLTPKYNEIDSNKVYELIDSVKDFYQVLDDFMDSRRLASDFNIDESAKVIFKEWRERNLEEFVNWGIESHYGDKADHIEETLFFFPLIGVLNRLAFQLSIDK